MMDRTTDTQAHLEERVRAQIGVEYGPLYGPQPVNAPMIRHWCEALDYDHPVLFGTSQGFPPRSSATVAPVAMMQVWTMQGTARDSAQLAFSRDAWRVLEIFEQAGYSAAVGAGTSQHYHRYAREGDRLGYLSSLQSISALKQTALGEGYFVTVHYAFIDQSGESVGTMDFTMFVYRTDAPLGGAR